MTRCLIYAVKRNTYSLNPRGRVRTLRAGPSVTRIRLSKPTRMRVVVDALAILGTAALPVCMGVAVLKYRLFELNRIISRVVSYTLITALLGGLFAGLVLLTTQVLPLRGSVAVAAATLVIAALFNPLRKRVQRAVDRRFNRARYDAEAVVAAYAG